MNRIAAIALSLAFLSATSYAGGKCSFTTCPVQCVPMGPCVPACDTTKPNCGVEFRSQPVDLTRLPLLVLGR